MANTPDVDPERFRMARSILIPTSPLEECTALQPDKIGGDDMLTDKP